MPFSSPGRGFLVVSRKKTYHTLKRWVYNPSTLPRVFPCRPAQFSGCIAAGGAHSQWKAQTRSQEVTGAKMLTLDEGPGKGEGNGIEGVRIASPRLGVCIWNSSSPVLG